MTDNNFSRREFLKKALKGGAILGGSGLALTSPLSLRYFFGEKAEYLSEFKANKDFLLNATPARYWTSMTPSSDCLSCHDHSGCHAKRRIFIDGECKHQDHIVRCSLCARNCVLKNGQRGECQSRINVNGELLSLVYGRPISIHIDPIEKMPFFHFLAGSNALSLATAGCPLSCKFCQNWEISQAKPENYSYKFKAPESIVNLSGSKSVPIIGFTYTEPTVFTEYLIDIAKIAKEKNIRSVLVSCGFMNEEPLTEMCEILDAIKIDLKGFDEEFYRKVCDAELKPVLKTIKQVARSNAHLELVNLVIPTLNDSDRKLTELVDWVMAEVGPEVPLHFTRFYPSYKLLNLPPTPIATLERAREIALDKGMHYAYIGNVPGNPGSNTYCPACGKIVIRRQGFFVLKNRLTNGCCEYCNHPISGVWS